MKNIILIGMPSAGKSTIGVILAKTLGLSFVDSDIVIQENTGKLLQEIINEDGIEEFLKIEESNILSLQYENTLIATGGSVVYSSSAMKHLCMLGQIIYLKVSYSEILRRIDNITTRGIALAEGQTLEDMYKERISLYEKYADITVDCDNLDMEEILSNLLESIK